MFHASRRGFLAGSVSLAALPSAAQAQGRDAFAAGFETPPDSARPRVWWHWMNGNVTKEGIAKDFAWMKRVGIGGVQNFDAALNTPQVVENRLVYMSPEWKDAFKFAVERAERLDLEFAIASSPGWSETGGPWVEPQDGMKKLVWSETVIEGGARYNAQLPPPPSVTGPYQAIATGAESVITPRETAPPRSHYADIAVMAYPIAEVQELPAPRSASVNGAVVDPNLLSDGDYSTGVAKPSPRAGEPGSVQIDFAQAQTVRSATVFVTNIPSFSVMGTVSTSIEYSGDGRTWRKIADVELRTVPTTLSFAPVRARSFRLAFEAGPPSDSSFFTMAPGVDLSSLLGSFGGGAPPVQQVVQFEVSPRARINAFESKAGFAIVNDYFDLDQSADADARGVDAGEIIDLTQHMTADGRLDWMPPPGRWHVVRLGYSLTGKLNHPATAEATGLEVDKYDAVAVEKYLNTYLDMYRDATGPRLMGARGLRALLTDSTEVGPSNWTPRMLEHFQRLRGYDAKPWLLALTGALIGSRAQSDGFLYDFRRTLAELHAREHYGAVAKVAHERGMIVYGESLEGNRAALGDDLDMRTHADIPMSALWTYGGTAPAPHYIADGRGAASVAHLRGSTLVACESLTSIGQPHTFAPRDLQPMLDAILLNGVNRPVIHTSVHQPLDRGPGFSLQVFGQNFTRLDSWAEMAKPWVDYMSRNCYLLQQGANVADVLYFYGEETPVAVQATGRYLSDVPKRYAYDFVSANLLDLLSVHDGEIVSTGGARYKALYLNAETTRMTVPALRKLAALVETGATLVGAAPESSPSLKDDPEEFAQLVRRLWGGGAVTQAGQGRVIAGRDIEAALAQAGLAPDFAYEGDADIQFVHRRFEGGELYFVSNRNAAPVATEARFRVTGYAPEFWRADTGAVASASYRTDEAHTIVPLNLLSHESVFVVFRTRSAALSITRAAPNYRQLGSVDGAWNVSFQEGRGAPANATLPALASLSENSDPGIKYFSGIAAYTNTFQLPADLQRGAPLLLDLGAIGDLAEVRVNGRVAGAVWKAPYRLDIGPYVRRGTNRLEVRVANTWVNRLIGDQQEGAQKVGFTTVPTFIRAAPLRPSGLIGPVTLWAEA